MLRGESLPPSSSRVVRGWLCTCQVLICVKGDGPQLAALASGGVGVLCQFGALMVPAQHVAHGVLRCIGEYGALLCSPGTALVSQ